jgi:biopolymer transport protein ExbD
MPVQKKGVALNLTALMDIFTILVFFLMVNSGDEQLIKDTETILLPRSIADQMPKETLIVAVDANTITIQGNVVATIDDINAMKNESSEDDIIPALKEELDRQAARRLELTEEEKVLGRPVTIQGDQKVPYLVLRKIMATSAMSGYRNISLAVVQKELKPEDVGGN